MGQPFQVISAIRNGIPFVEVEQIVHSYGITYRDLAQTVKISPRTFHRRKETGRMDQEQSEKFVRVRHVLDEATKLKHGDKQRAVAWLKTPAKALNGVSPMSLLDTAVGENTVLNLIGALREGMML